jgi:fructose-bisphosphate aldolase class 1
LARYAALRQEAGLVPIVESEVLMNGDHTIERCAAATQEVLQTVSISFTGKSDDPEDMNANNHTTRS